MWDLFLAAVQNWPVWLVTITLVVAAVIDGRELRVPNAITLPLIVAGWGFCLASWGFEGLGWSLLGTAVGLALLIPLYAIGGMGAGDVKLLAGVGAWVGPEVTFYAFCLSAVVGGVLAIGMVLWRRSWRKHTDQMLAIASEVLTVRDPVLLSKLAADRKPSMLLLPYGIPIAIGAIFYFAWTGMLV